VMTRWVAIAGGIACVLVLAIVGNACRKGTITFAISPEGSSYNVRIDGKQVSLDADHSLIVRRGQHRVEVRAPGYHEWSETVAVDPGRQQKVSVTLVKIRDTGDIRISSSPDGAKVFCDGKLVGAAPHTLLDLKPGRYTTRLQKEGYRSWSEVCELAAEQVIELSPTLQPLPAKIVYIGCPRGLPGCILAVNEDGGDNVVVSHGPYSELAVSPDGKKIVAATLNGIVLMNINGTGRKVISEYQKVEGLDWSPDGKKIAFSYWTLHAIGEGGPFPWQNYLGWHVFVMDSDGRDVKEVTNLKTDDRNPSWFPDGRRIAFERGADIYVMNVDGSGQGNVTPWRDDTESCRYPEVSRDGKRILFAYAKPDCRDRLATMNTDGSGLGYIDEPGAGREQHVMPKWSRDGNKILYYSQQEGAWHVVSSGGSNDRKVCSSGGAGENSASWAYAELESGQGKMTIDSEPSGARIYVDGSYSGSLTPKQFTLESGAHRIRLALAGYLDWEQVITVTPGEKRTIKPKLTAP
jgi:Tol biopolymer transport system component